MSSRGIVVAVAALAGLLTPSALAENPAAAMLGEPAPPFRLPDVRSGEEVSLEDLRGRIIVLHFAASW